MKMRGASVVVPVTANCGENGIQRALDAICGGGEVVLAPGVYKIQQPLILSHDNQTLRGTDHGATLLLADRANCPVVILGAALDSSRRMTSHLRLANLMIDGNRKNQQVELWRTAVDGSQLNNNGVDIWNADDVTIEHVICCRCRSGGLVTAETRHLNVSDFAAYDNQFDGLACYETEQSQFSGLRLYDNLAAGISVDLFFNHNVIRDALLTGNCLGIFMRAARDNLFKGLSISGSRRHGVFMAQSDGPTAKGWSLCPGTECTGNHFDGLVVKSCGGDAFLVNNASCTNNVIRDARFLGNVLGGLAEGDGKPAGISLTLASDPAPEIKPITAQAGQANLIRAVSEGGPAVGVAAHQRTALE
jgi:hypothetical protein